MRYSRSRSLAWIADQMELSHFSQAKRVGFASIASVSMRAREFKMRMRSSDRAASSDIVRRFHNYNTSAVVHTYVSGSKYRFIRLNQHYGTISFEWSVYSVLRVAAANA